MSKSFWRPGFTAALLILLAAVGAFTWWSAAQGSASTAFDGVRALDHVRAQVALGPRVPGSAAHAQFLDWLQAGLSEVGWDSEIQEVESLGHPIKNLIAHRSDASPQLILGAHFDSRIRADRDPDASRQGEATPGANDGASGVAVLLELARVLDENAPPTWLAFFDAEDNGRIEGWDWILGSRAFASSLQARPRAVVIVDMVGDADLQIYFERNSDPALRAAIWETAASLGYGEFFIAREGQSIIDDHLPFLELGIPAVDIIDINYPYWHTTQDTPDKLSAESLRAVGETLRVWIEAQAD